MQTSRVTQILNRNLIFVSGKGGVGKTAVSQALALAFSRKGARTLWTTFEDPGLPQGELRRISPTLDHLNCEAGAAFEEYAGLKIGVNALTRIFLQNKLIRYLAKAAPGIHELVLLGKVWHERENYRHVIVDMPSTGYGLTMFQSTQNFSHLFKGGPIQKDADRMLDTFGDAAQTGQLIIGLPEEMPLQESVELGEFLLKMFPENHPAFLVNRRFPEIQAGKNGDDPDSWTSPVPRDALDYIQKRSTLERYNLKLWERLKIPYSQLPLIPPSLHRSGKGDLVERLALEWSPLL